MRIAQVSPLFESVPPRFYGGTERVVAYLIEELVAAGHDVTLFASGDSQTSARLLPGCRTGLRLDRAIEDPVAHHVALVGRVFERAADFDLIHFHTEPFHYPLLRHASISVPVVTTLHGRLDLPDLPALFAAYPDVPVISISDDQRRPLPDLDWQGTIHHGLPRDLLRPGDGSGGYLAFLGRLSPEKRPDRAIEIARRAGLPLRLAAKVEPNQEDYWNECIAPSLDGGDVEFVGEIDERGKQDFLGNARALLFPIDWPEPFGLVMIEAMACGTPVIAFRRGSVPEILEDGVTGFLVESVDEAVAAVRCVGELDRAQVRRCFEERFTSRRMMSDHLALYRRLCEGRSDVRVGAFTGGLAGRSGA